MIPAWKCRLRTTETTVFASPYMTRRVPQLEKHARKITIFRTHASAAGIPATYTLSVKVVETTSGQERNELEPLVTKGTLLPADGSKSFRAAKRLRGGQPETN